MSLRRNQLTKTPSSHLDNIIAKEKENDVTLLALIEQKVTPIEFTLVKEQIKKIDTLTNVVPMIELCEQINRANPENVFSFLAFLTADQPLIQRELFRFAQNDLDDREFNLLFQMNHQTILKLVNAPSTVFSHEIFQSGLQTPLQTFFQLINKIFELNISEDEVLKLLDNPAALFKVLSENVTLCNTPNHFRSASAHPLTSLVRRSGSPIHAGPQSPWRNSSTDALPTLLKKLGRCSYE